MDLVISMQQDSSVVNVRRAHRTPAWECNRTHSTLTGANVTTATIRTTDPILVIDPVAGRNAISEAEQIRIGTRPAVELCQFGGRQDPNADAIPIRHPAL